MSASKSSCSRVKIYPPRPASATHRTANQTRERERGCDAHIKVIPHPFRVHRLWHRCPPALDGPGEEDGALGLAVFLREAFGDGIGQDGGEVRALGLSEGCVNGEGQLVLGGKGMEVGHTAVGGEDDALFFAHFIEGLLREVGVCFDLEEWGRAVRVRICWAVGRGNMPG